MWGMTVKNIRYLKTYKVIFAPDEERELLKRFPRARIQSIVPRTDLKPWGTREAVMTERVRG